MRYVALLRGINVGGNTMIKMEELRKTFEALGFTQCHKLYQQRQPGVRCRKACTKEEARRTKLINEIESRSKPLWQDYPDDGPRTERHWTHSRGTTHSKDEYGSHKEMHVLFLKERNAEGKTNYSLTETNLEKERFAVEGREIYCHLTMGVADSLLGKALSKRN